MRISSRSTPFERIEYVLILSVLMLLVVVTLQPILNLVAISFSSPANVPGMSGLEIIPQGFSLDVWKLLLTNEAVLRGFGNAMLITVVGTIINVVFTVLLAWALAQKRLPGRRWLFMFVLFTIVFEPGIIPDFLVMKKLGLLNSYWSVILYRAVFAWYLIILVHPLGIQRRRKRGALPGIAGLQRASVCRGERSAAQIPAVPGEMDRPDRR